MVGFGSCAGAVVDFDVDMREVFTIGPERVLQTTPGVYFGEAPRAAASFNHTNHTNEDGEVGRSDCQVGMQSRQKFPHYPPSFV